MTFTTFIGVGTMLFFEAVFAVLAVAALAHLFTSWH